MRVPQQPGRRARSFLARRRIRIARLFVGSSPAVTQDGRSTVAAVALEMFGPALGPYAAVACVISFLMRGHRSVNPSQVLAMRKSPSLRAEVGKELDEVRTEFAPPHKRLLIRALRRLRRSHHRDRDDGGHSS